MTKQIEQIEFKNITKRFPGVLACDNIDLQVNSGEILALLGENGAGKTTLMNILYGLYQPDEGEIFLNGESIKIDTPQKAGMLGIGMVHQHFMLVPNLTVKENVALCMFNDSAIRLDMDFVSETIKEISAKHRIKIDPDTYIWELSVGEQQRVELIKALSLGANLLILDEPTAVLTPQETDKLILLLQEMAANGCSIIFISHKLNEVKAVSHHVAVLRNGKMVYNGSTDDHTTDELATLMAGRDITLPIAKEKDPSKNIILDIQNVTALSDRGTESLDGLSLTLDKGEILGIAGVSGNGQNELAEVINGLRRVESGRILLDGEDITNRTPQQIIDRNMGYIPADRLHEGTVATFSVKENLILKDYAHPPLSKGTFLINKTISSYAEDLIAKFNIKTPGIDTTCASLSGGNIQKVIVAREINRNPKYVMQSGPGSSILGMLAAVAVGAVMGGIMALVCVKFKAEQGIAGIALYMFGWGVAGMLFRVYIGGTTSIVGLKAINFPALTDMPVLGPILFSHNIMVYITLIIVPFSWYLLNKTAWGLKVKAVGTAPRAADTMGVKVDRTRVQCVVLAGAMAGLAGAYLSICQTHMYADNITAGRGFIAVALVYFGKWKPSGILFGALLFSLAHSFQRSIQVYGIDFPYEVAVVFPYLLVIVVLALSGRSKTMAPAVLGKPYYRELRD